MVSALVRIGGHLADDDELPDYAHLKWAEWKELNGAPYPPRRKEIGLLTMHLAMVLIYLLGFITLVAVVIMVAFKLLKLLWFW